MNHSSHPEKDTSQTIFRILVSVLLRSRCQEHNHNENTNTEKNNERNTYNK